MTVCVQVERVVQRVMQQHGRLDGVVNCVGSVVAASTLATDLDKLQDALKVGRRSQQWPHSVCVCL